MSRKNFLKEQKILSKTVQKIKEKIYLIKQSSKKYKENVKSNNYLPGDGISHRRAMLDKDSLKDALSEPYFGKIDIHRDQGGIEHYYIGNQGVVDRNQNTIVVDWRKVLRQMPGLIH